MRTSFLLLVVFAAAGQAQTLSNSGPVYFWPMTSAFDQYLAQEASGGGVLNVTVDPKNASAVMTDRIDGKFLEGLDEIFPLPEDPSRESDEEEASSDSIEGSFQLQRPANRPVGRPRGTLFLVDIKTRNVLWSTFLKEFDATPDRLQRKARSVIEKLQQELGAGS